MHPNTGSLTRDVPSYYIYADKKFVYISIATLNQNLLDSAHYSVPVKSYLVQKDRLLPDFIYTTLAFFF